MTAPAGLAAVRAAMAAPEPVTLPEGMAPAQKRVDPAEMALRQDRAAELIGALQSAHPDDCRIVLSGALLDLTRAASGAAFGPLDEDAHFWAGMFTHNARFPLLLSAATRLGDPAFYAELRKRLLLALVDTLSATERAAFIAHIGGHHAD